RNITQHYDLGNQFYQTWLDDSMTYSSALFDSPVNSNLGEAQTAKFQRIVDELQLTADDTLLDIGCGWGSFAKYAAKSTGASVTGITLSSEQLRYARKSQNSDSNIHCNFLLKDYRDLEGEYSKISSIEMIEAVGKENWKNYFKILYERLSENGTAVIQAITINEDWYEEYCRRPDFIQRFIFPGGFLPTSRTIFENASAAGFTVENSLSFGDSYATTLQHWREHFQNAWPQIRNLGFDNEFKRMWEYYLTYCAAGFEYGSIEVGLFRLTKHNHSCANY
ncbi:MAG: class I SAM-dependent methyltransferase, partial [Desulfobulbia bacterium]